MEDGDTPLHNSARHGSAEAIQMLLGSSCSVDARNEVSGKIWMESHVWQYATWSTLGPLTESIWPLAHSQCVCPTLPLSPLKHACDLFTLNSIATGGSDTTA